MSHFCEKCHKTREEKYFYVSNNLEKYPNGGHINLCKDCATRHIDNWDSSTYLWLLEELDIPYVPDVWNNTLTKALDSGRKITGLTVIGKYISQMKLSTYKNYRWKDSEYLQEKKRKQVEKVMRERGYTQQQIDTALDTMIIEPPPKPEENLVPLEPISAPLDIGKQVEQQMIAGLTESDRVYLCTQWGKTYTADEWVRLEELYQQMLSSYDIQSAGDLNTLKLACKASLKANQLIDIGDIEGAQKAMKMYESMMKAGKWTASQNQTEDGEYIDSIGELVNLCEKDGYIEKFYIDQPNDSVDKLMMDLKHYTTNLIKSETGLDVLVERAQIQLEEEEARLAIAKEQGEEEIFKYDDIDFTAWMGEDLQ